MAKGNHGAFASRVVASRRRVAVRMRVEAGRDELQPGGTAGLARTSGPTAAELRGEHCGSDRRGDPGVGLVAIFELVDGARQN